MNTEIAGLFIRLISGRVNYKQGNKEYAATQEVSTIGGIHHFYTL
jgi:hypothetical protein